MHWAAVLLLCTVLAPSGWAATIYNNVSRYDVNGKIIDCHSGAWCSLRLRRG
jgi:hypothetical protein